MSHLVGKIIILDTTILIAVGIRATIILFHCITKPNNDEKNKHIFDNIYMRIVCKYPLKPYRLKM